MNPRFVERKIARLTREIAQIDDYFYGANKNDDRSLYARMLEPKRDDMIRSAVLQFHTAIEDILDSLIICCFLDVEPEHRKAKMRTNSGRALHKMLFGAGTNPDRLDCISSFSGSLSGHSTCPFALAVTRPKGAVFTPEKWPLLKPLISTFSGPVLSDR